MNKSHWWHAIKPAWSRWTDVDGDQRSAAFAFYLLLSVLPLTILIVATGSLFVEREVATQSLVELGNHHTVLSTQQEEAAVATIHGMLEVRGAVCLLVIPLLLWGALKFLHTREFRRRPRGRAGRASIIRTAKGAWTAETIFPKRRPFQQPPLDVRQGEKANMVAALPTLNDHPIRLIQTKK